MTVHPACGRDFLRHGISRDRWFRRADVTGEKRLGEAYPGFGVSVAENSDKSLAGSQFEKIP